MLNLSLVVSVCLLAALCSHVHAQCPEREDFLVKPGDVVAHEGDVIVFNCSIIKSAVTERGSLPRWEYRWLNSTVRVPLVREEQERLSHIYQLVRDTSDPSVLGFNLRVNVSFEVAGEHYCTLEQNECDTMRGAGTLRVYGKPVISIHNDSFSVETQESFFITGKIAGHPPPSVSILREVDGEFVEIEDSRFNFNFDSNTADLSITLDQVVRADAREYRIVATNPDGSVDADFSIVANGPDRPVVSFTSSSPFPNKVVARIGSVVEITCNVQEDAIDPTDESETTVIEWSDPQGDILIGSGSSLSVGELENSGRVLTIHSLSNALLGNYSCRASNSRGMDSSTIPVFGPPPPPSDIPLVSMNGNQPTISWTRPPSSNPVITSYRVTLYISGQDTPTFSDMVRVDVTQSEVSYTFQGLNAGTYEVTVTSAVGPVLGDPTERASFIVQEAEFPLLPVVIGASVGGVVILVVIILVVVCVYCTCANRKANPNSHQQRWGSDEDKVNQPAPTIQNTYTALALHDSSELPPSPLSPTMTSAIGIDPKWEFPRENIQLSDVLAEGQFTVLYKGIARNLKEKACEVAVKAVKEDATEDDVKALVYEMDLLSSIEEHPNIVSLVRVCSVGKPLYMVMEYMCHGDLLGFLRACRGHHGMYTVSPGSGYQPPPKHLFTSRDILNMATKIANGMRYLADRKIVHRALCTRNILVGSGMDVKIYNVGSFDASLDGIAKWMAPETLFDGTNTTYSDVWSFGVTLWELVTVGGTPYGEILPEDLYAQLQSGMRMPCPTHCAQEVYQIMSACWQKNPTDRPHFSIIHDSLDELVMSKLNYVDVRSSDIDAYSQFDGDVLTSLSTAL